MMTALIECPLSGCDWETDATPPQVPADALSAVFGPGVLTATSAFGHAMDVERRLREHLGTHRLEEWVAEITRLKGEIAALRAPGREFSDRFTVFPDSGVIELNCFRCDSGSDTWTVNYHPSLDALVEQARAHDQAKHRDSGETAGSPS